MEPVTRDGITDLVESVGASCVIEVAPIHPGGRSRVPLVTVRYQGRTQVFQHATWRDVGREVERWLQDVVREAD